MPPLLILLGVHPQIKTHSGATALTLCCSVKLCLVLLMSRTHKIMERRRRCCLLFSPTALKWCKLQVKARNTAFVVKLRICNVKGKKCQEGSWSCYHTTERPELLHILQQFFLFAFTAPESKSSPYAPYADIASFFFIATRTHGSSWCVCTQTQRLQHLQRHTCTFI